MYSFVFVFPLQEPPVLISREVDFFVFLPVAAISVVISFFNLPLWALFHFAQESLHLKTWRWLGGYGELLTVALVSATLYGMVYAFVPRVRIHYPFKALRPLLEGKKRKLSNNRIQPTAKVAPDA